MASLLLFLIITVVVFMVLLIFVLPRLLYIGVLLYHVFKRKKEQTGKRFSQYKLKDLKEAKSEKIK